MIFLQNTFFETNKQISLCLLGSVFAHVVVISYFLIDNVMTKEIDADLLRPQAIPVQIVFQAKSLTAPQTTYKKPAVQKPKAIQETTTSPEKVVVEKPVEQTSAPAQTTHVEQIEPAAGASTHVSEAKNIPVVSGASLVGRRVQPEYPKKSLRLKQEGTVFLHVLISPTGARQDIKLHKPSKYALLNQAALKAVKKWTFDPNVVNGRGVQSWVEIPIEFKIQ